MKETFREYYRPTNEDFSNLWKHAQFVIDANVLLNLYRYSPQARGDLIEIFQKISDRIWIPHQAALEYQENRLTVISQQESAYKKIKQILETCQKNIGTELNSCPKNPFIDANHTRKKINAVIAEVKDELDSKKLDHPDLIDNDELRDTITSLFDKKVGPSYPSDEIEKIYKLGSERYSRKTPPGFEDTSKDKNKGNVRKYGDLVLWFQIIDYAKSTKKPIIFITDDGKEDWWQTVHGQTHGPHPQLINEIFSKANVDFYMYRPLRFMEFYSEYFEIPVNKETLAEIQEIGKQDEKDKKRKEITDVYRLISKDFAALGDVADFADAVDIATLAARVDVADIATLAALAEEYKSLHKLVVQSGKPLSFHESYNDITTSAEKWKSLNNIVVQSEKQKKAQLETEEQPRT